MKTGTILKRCGNVFRGWFSRLDSAAVAARIAQLARETVKRELQRRSSWRLSEAEMKRDEQLFAERERAITQAEKLISCGLERGDTVLVNAGMDALVRLTGTAPGPGSNEISGGRDSGSCSAAQNRQPPAGGNSRDVAGGPDLSGERWDEDPLL